MGTIPCIGIFFEWLAPLVDRIFQHGNLDGNLDRNLDKNLFKAYAVGKNGFAPKIDRNLTAKGLAETSNAELP